MLTDGISTRLRKHWEDGSNSFAGKYSAPDYELILSKNCDLAIESTMIYHKPEVKEKLEQFGIPGSGRAFKLRKSSAWPY